MVTGRPAQVGTTRKFAFSAYGGVSQDRTVEATLVASSARGLAYVERGFAAVHNGTSVDLTQAQLIYSEKMDIVGRLASGVAHEVKNPLAILLQCVEYLTRSVGNQSDKVAMTLKFMAEAVTRADNIIKGMLDFSSISTARRMTSTRGSRVASERRTIFSRVGLST